MRNLIIALGILIVIGLSLGILYLVNDSSEPNTNFVPPDIPGQFIPSVPIQPVDPVTSSEAQIEVLIKNELLDMPQVSLGATTIASNYALQLWFDENIGGEALLVYENSEWRILSLGGGAWDVNTLIEQGVPNPVAIDLVNNRQY